ncbi:MAG: glycosyltransferase [Taibaiella sp.]|nr:glycosyltransferase [Taibaiella sp.]
MCETLIILSPGFPANEDDTTCLPALQLPVKAIKKMHPELEVIVIAFQYPFSLATYEWHGCTVVSFNGQNKGKGLRLAVWMRVWSKLRALLKEKNVIGILSFWCTECALVGHRFGLRYGVQHINWVLGQDALPTNKYVARIKPKADELVAMSDSIAEVFQKNHHILPAHIIGNGIDPSLYTEGTGIRDIDIIGAGSLIPLKRYDIFIEIIKELSKANPAIKCLLAGKGEMEDRLKEMVNGAGMQNNITFLGEVPHKEIIYLMQRAKILLHPSDYEGYSTVCSEALFAGAHVVSFCKPLKHDIDHWHIVRDKEEMLQQCYNILANERDFSCISVGLIDDNAEAFMRLFGYDKGAIE